MQITQPWIDPCVHGGADAQGQAAFDFSTNSNACGPCPIVLSALLAVDSSHYPDPNYTQLRSLLAQFHGVELERVLIAASASEFIFRMSVWAKLSGLSGVALPKYHYNDYARAARAMQLVLHGVPSPSSLVWACEPSSPLGQADVFLQQKLDTKGVWIVDLAYAPLRLSGESTLNASDLGNVWQLWTPNKALGLTGIRAAYAIAPHGAQVAAQNLNALAPSWSIGSHGVAMLAAWTQPEVQQWIKKTKETLKQWKLQQILLCESLGWTCAPSDTNFFCAKPALPLSSPALRQYGIKLRDCSSFGLSGWVRLGVLSPAAQAALRLAIERI